MTASTYTTKEDVLPDDIQTSFFDKFLFISVLGVTLSFFLIMPLQNTFLRHCIVAIGSSIFYIIALLRLIKKRISFILIISIGFFSIISVISFSSNIYSINNDLIYSSINFLTFIILISTNNPSILNNPKNRKNVYYFCIISSFVLLVLSRTDIAYVFETGYENGFLALGMTNSNLTGMLLFAITGILIVYLEKIQSLLFLLILCMIYLIILTGSRSSLIAIFSLLTYSFFFTNKRLSNAIIILVMFIPLALMLIYIWLSNVLESDVVFLGKPLFSGRQTIYIDLLQRNFSIIDILFGNAKDNSFSNNAAPNGPMSIYLFSGLFGIVLFYSLFISKLCKFNTTRSSDYQRKAIFLILCIFILSTTETFFFTGIFPGITYIYIFSLMIDSSFDSKDLPTLNQNVFPNSIN